MARSFADSRAWMHQGTTLLIAAVDGLGEDGYRADSLLPGWTRAHVVAHLAANAEALGNLVHWAASGQETPMYASADERAAGIERGVKLSANELDAWLRDSAQTLKSAMDALTEEQWQHEVRTAQGRMVPASETPWMRSREVLVHAVDLGLGIEFDQLPAEFNTALREDILAKRGLEGIPDEIADADPAQLTAWLAGRPHTIDDAPDLGPWL